MSKRRDEIEEALAHDEVADGIHEGWEWLVRHKNTIITAALVVAIAVLGYTFIHRTQSNKRIDASTMFLTAMEQFNAYQNMQDAEQRQAMFESLNVQLDELIDRYPDMTLGQEALYLKGQAQYIAGEYQQAQETYEAYLEAVSDPEQQARGEIALAYAHENQAFFLQEAVDQRNRLTTAETHYNSAIEYAEQGSYLYYYARMGIARIKELIRDNDAAIEIYEEIIAERPGREEPEAVEDEDMDPNSIESMIKELVESQEAQLSFAATAKLRLDRLKAQQTTASNTITE